MNRREARAKAHALWGTAGINGVVVVRRKSVVDRFEVGYQTRDGRPWTVMGRGPSWEEAFARAAEVRQS